MNQEGELRRFQFSLLNDALSKGIERNEEQRKTWTAYKNGHLKVIEALQIFPRDLHVHCMVPLGKRALMKGKLIHTNEILANLGGEYFAKYSASGAVALCQRRIEKADEMLKNLSTERDLYESRMMVPENMIFEECAGKDITEHWNEEEVEQWRKQHREREKEYHQKLAKNRQEERKEIETEDDLFQRLDELEIEEELADELHRSKDGEYEFVDDELAADECYSDTESISDDEEYELNNESETSNHSESKQFPKNVEKSKKTVLFAEPDNDISNEKPGDLSEKAETNEVTKDTEKDVLRIDFSHSQNESDMKQSGETIESPSDIYRIFSKPRSILKRSPNDIPHQQILPLDLSMEEEEEEEEDTVKPSAYEVVVKDIKEKSMETPPNNYPVKASEQRPVSKFKRERGLKK